MKIPVWVKPGVWGAVAGAIAMSIIGFSQLGWTTSATAEQLAQAVAAAEKSADEARQALASTELSESEATVRERLDAAKEGVRGLLALISSHRH